MILDVILVVLFLIIILYGYKKGAIAIIARIITVILSFVLAYLLAGLVGEYIAQTSLGASINTSITNGILTKLEGLSESEMILKAQEIWGVGIENQISAKISSYVFTSIGFAVVFVISRIALWVGQKILESIFELPVLKTFNKIGGMIASALLFLIELSIVLTIIKSMSALAFMNSVVKFIESSVITEAIYNHNIVADWVLIKFIK